MKFVTYHFSVSKIPFIIKVFFERHSPLNGGYALNFVDLEIFEPAASSARLKGRDYTSTAYDFIAIYTRDRLS